MAMYKKPDVSRLTRAAHIAAISRSGKQERGLSGAAMPSGIRAMRVLRGGLGFEEGPVTSYEYAGPTGEATITKGDGWSEYNAGIQSSSGGSSIGTGIMSAISGLFSSKPATTGYVPTSSNTTYLLIGGGVLGIALLYVLLK